VAVGSNGEWYDWTFPTAGVNKTGYSNLFIQQNYLADGSASASWYTDGIYMSVTYTLPATVGSFTATPGTVVAGVSSTLAWSCNDASSANISPTVGNVGTSGSTSVTPLATTQYTLTCYGSGGNATANKTVTVNRAPSFVFVTQ
jgi:hypothetical protein